MNNQSTPNKSITLSMNGMNCIRFNYGNTFTISFRHRSFSQYSFLKSLTGNECINKNKKMTLNGISGSTKSIGEINITLNVEHIEINHNFLVIDDIGHEIHAILGSEFFSKYNAIIDFRNFSLSFWINKQQLILPLESNFNECTIIPPRSEIVKYFWVDDECDCVVLSSEITEGVFTAGIIARPVSHIIAVRILNTKDEEIKIKNFRPVTLKLTDFESYKFDKNEISLDRVNKVVDLINVENLNKEERNSIHRICAKYADIFLLENDPVTVTNIIKEIITLKKDIRPVYVKPYRLPHSQKNEIDRQISKMLADGIIEETKSNWSSPLLLVPKKGTSGSSRSRVVIDYRLVNKQLEDDRFPLPNITEILDSLSGSFYFSHLDLSQGYYQVELDPSCRKYTAFTTGKSQYQMTRLPMGLKKSPSAFSRVMTIAMSGLNYESCFVYLDDLIVFGNNLQNHNQNLVKVMNQLRQVNLKLNPANCEFLKDRLLYLGHEISSSGVFPDKSKITAVLNYPIPKNTNECKKFVAFINYYRKFIPKFAKIAYPLNKLSRKSVEFKWDENCQKSFDELKEALINPPVLEYPDFSPSNTFKLTTDASGYAIGAVLSNCNNKPIAYASRALNPAEIKYPITHKELLSITWAVNHFRPYLYGRKFEIYTDHRPLIYLFGMNNPSSRLTKFRLILEEYDFTIHYVKGNDNSVADALSRVKIDSNDVKEMSSNILAITRSMGKQKLIIILNHRKTLVMKTTIGLANREL